MKLHPLSLDIISTLPSAIIENILCLLPIKEAARTSILSKEWRYKWTKIPKLVFLDHMFKESADDVNQVSVLEETVASERKKMGERCKLFYAIYQVLLMRQGPVDEFALSMDGDKTCVEIDHIISYLSRNNTVKNLELNLFETVGGKYVLPLSIFSWHHLTDLHLNDCGLILPPTFNGFGSLTTLYLQHVYISTKNLLQLLSNCPLLKRFTLLIFKEDLLNDVEFTIIELLKCLPMVEELSTLMSCIGCFVLDSVSQELPTSLIHLRYFSMEFMSFADDHVIPFLALLIRSSPNLEKIELQITSRYGYNEIDPVILEKYLDIWCGNLIDLKIYGFSNVKFDLEFLKFILAKSPKLKDVLLWFDHALDKKKESKILRFLLCSPPASPVVEFTVRAH